MAPRQSQKIESQASDSEDANSLLNSQEDALDVMKEANNIVSVHNVRREKKRKAIEGEHEQRVKDVRAKMDSLFAVRKGRVTKSQQDLWIRLDALDKKRQGLESLILTSMKAIEAHSINISSELTAMFEGRIEEIEGSPAVEE